MKLTIIDMDSVPCPHCGRWVYVDAIDHHRNQSCPSRLRLIANRTVAYDLEFPSEQLPRRGVNYR